MADVNETDKKIADLQKKRNRLKSIVSEIMIFKELDSSSVTKKETINVTSKQLIPKKELASWIKLGDNLQKTKEAAQKGEAYAQRRLYRIYDYVYNNKVKGLYWKKKAAENGDAIAQSNLGFDYQNGNTGLKKNYKEAVKWYRKSALQGDKVGQHNLAVMLENGFGIEKSYTHAFNWYKKAAKQGSQSAKKELQKMGID
ncbi:MAG: sel1 repeat family protein [Flavobacteriaceae bacterium]|nr:sel1 repeat family protein [Flavobacteriaceae bacterium]